MPMSLAKALPRPCPSCGEVAEGVFCPHDGTPLEGEFSIGGDRYVVEELIGNGAMAIVFGGKHRTLSRPVAVKILRPEVAQNAEQQQRFLREARSASRLTHENIVGVLDFGWDNDLGVTYMVMERLFGRTLASELGHGGPIAWREVVSLLAQVCRALHAAHSLGIVHRDLTSRNVILVQSAQASGRQVVKLCDFGLSRHTAGGDRVTNNGAWVGTPAYMAPEQLDADPRIEASADIYSIGVLAHEMLTGHLPIEGNSVVEVVAAKLSDEPPPISARFPAIALPEELEQVISRCLERDPSRRPTAAELERTLVRIDARATQAGPIAERVSAPAAPTFPALDEGTPSMVGSYRVVRSLGSGGTGRVYLGEHPVIGTKVAIKVLLPEIAGSRETVERFIQEARTSSQIESPHIPRYYDFGRTAGGLPYAVMEYFEGETLAEHIEKTGALSVEACADILGQVAGALHLAHAAGLVHRDLKPENIFLVAAEPKLRAATDPGAAAEAAFNVKVLDFGIAKTFGKESGTRTQQGFFLGTPFYCAPEQVFGAEVDPRADVYGLGATAFEMLTGLPPFVGEISEVLEAKTSKDAPLLRSQRGDLPELVEATIAKMLARDPAARAPSMTWVQERVTSWLLPDDSAVDLLELPPTPAPAKRSGSQPSTQGTAPSLRDLSARALSSSSSSSLNAMGAASSSGSLRRAASSGALRAGVYETPSSAQLAIPAAAASQPSMAARGAPSDADFDVLETVTLLPGSIGPRAVVRVPSLVEPRPLWRRPGFLLVGAALVIGAIAVAYIGTSGPAAVGASGSAGVPGAPSVTPIDPGGAVASPSAHHSTSEGPPKADETPVASAPNPANPPPVAVGEPGSDDRHEAAGGSDEGQPPSETVEGKGKGRHGRHKPGSTGNRPKEKGTPTAEPTPKGPAEPKESTPTDVKIVNPFP
jgi:serine/threonine protein kinase